MDILDNFNIFGCRRSIDVLDPEEKPGSGSGKILPGSGPRDFWRQKYENLDFEHYLKWIEFWNFPIVQRYRALDPKLTKTRILSTEFK